MGSGRNGFSRYLLVVEMTIKIERKPAYHLTDYLECHRTVITEFKDGDVHFLPPSLGNPENFFFPLYSSCKMSRVQGSFSLSETFYK